MTSKWSDLPSDILQKIADDRKVGIPQLRAVCKSWRSSLSSLPSSSITFPLTLPSPPSNSLSSPSHLSLFQRSTYLLTPLSNPCDDGFLIKVEESANSPNTFSLINPLFSLLKLPPPISPINLLDYNITHLCNSYVVRSDLLTGRVPIKKVVVASDFLVKGDFVVLGLKDGGDLLFWKLGDDVWTKIVPAGQCYDDIICYNGRFYATADKKRMLVMMDSRLEPIILVEELRSRIGACTSLVECDGNLYLVAGGSKFGLFKLGDNGRSLDYDPSLNGCVFFLGGDASFSFSRKDYNGCIKDVIYFKGILLDDIQNGGFSRVFDMKTGSNSLVMGSERFEKFHWPPSSWFVERKASYFR